MSTDASRPRISRAAGRFTESVIREMSRICRREGGINLAQGFPDFPAPAPMKEAAKRAIDADVNQYAVTFGAPDLRAAIADRTGAARQGKVDAEQEITVCCGATEAMIAALLAVTDPGDEVVIFEPFYENYGPDCILSGATPKFVRLRGSELTIDPAELRAAFGPRARAVLVNTPHNPTGKVFSRGELELIAGLCLEFDAYAITDEIYEEILYDGAEHIPLASLPDMTDRTITISGLSKTWSATGWRIGWAVAPPDLTGGIRKVHDFLTVGAAAPLQEAAAEALRFDRSYFDDLRSGYARRRDLMLGALDRVGLRTVRPSGAYYVMADLTGFTDLDDVAFAQQLVAGGGVACVPGSSFFAESAEGRNWIRFCFAKREETLQAAADRLVERLG